MLFVYGEKQTGEKKTAPTIYQAQDKYPEPAVKPKDKETLAKEELYYCFGQNGKKNPLPTPKILTA